MEKGFNLFSRYLLGVVFIFSGFVKALDPFGSAYKFSDYFQAFHIGFLDGISLSLGILLAAFELVLGLVLILGYQKRITSYILLVFMSFFTVLTFILAITNPVSDCGCFGDAIIMTNWQTFFKNLVLMVFVIILFRQRDRFANEFSTKTELGLVLLFFAIVISFSVRSANHLPVIDFRPYSTGTNIRDAMSIPEGAQMDEYSTLLFYENTESGKTEEFTLENYPQDTLKYRFVTSESKRIKKGFEPPIHDFGIQDPYGMDITDQILNDRGYTLFMLCYDLDKANNEVLQEMNRWADVDKLSEDLTFIPVTSTAGAAQEEIQRNLNLEYKFYAGDEIMLKTMLRSNPGFMLLKGETILAKWAGKDFPGLENWNDDWPELINQYSEEQDPEIQMMIDEGILEQIEYDIIDFDEDAVSVVASYHSARSEALVWKVFILLVTSIIVILFSLSSSQKRKLA